jgi:hypothetical protein
VLILCDIYLLSSFHVKYNLFGSRGDASSRTLSWTIENLSISSLFGNIDVFHRCLLFSSIKTIKFTSKAAKKKEKGEKRDRGAPPFYNVHVTEWFMKLLLCFLYNGWSFYQALINIGHSFICFYIRW